MGRGDGAAIVKPVWYAPLLSAEAENPFEGYVLLSLRAAFEVSAFAGSL